jgi:ribokinase
MPEVIALGDTNVDIIAHFSSYPDKGEDALAYSTEIHCGGSAANTAIALARMGIETSLISRVGPDSWALKALGCLSEAGVNPQGLQRDPAAMTGMMYVIVTPDGERTILGHRGANVLTDPSQIREEDFSDATLFHLSGYALLAEPQRSAALLALEMAHRHGLTVTLDPGMALPQVGLDELGNPLAVVNILLPSLGEARHLTGMADPEDCTGALLDQGVEVVVLKMGTDGCLVSSDQGSFLVPGFAVKTRDSTGAGDSFAAGFIAGFLGGLDWRSAAVLGNAMGARTAARIGAGAEVPTAQEVLNLLDGCFDEPTHSDSLEAIQRVMQYVTRLSTEPEEEGKPWWK